MNILDDNLSVIVNLESFSLLILKKEKERIEKISKNYILNYNKNKQCYNLYYNLKLIDEIRNDDVVKYEFEYFIKCQNYDSIIRLIRKYKIEKILSKNGTHI